MVITLPCENEFIILSKDITYLCWFYNGEWDKDGLNIDKICLQLSEKFKKVPCLRFDYSRKCIYRFLDCITCSSQVFLYRKSKVTLEKKTKITPSVLLNCFKNQMIHSDKGFLSLPKKSVNTKVNHSVSSSGQKYQKKVSTLVRTMSNLIISPQHLKNRPRYNTT